MLDGPRSQRVRTTVSGEGEDLPSLVVRAGLRYLRDAMPDRAASLAYYGMFSIFPSLLIISGAIRLIGVDTPAGEVSGFAQDHGVSSELAGSLRSAFESAQSTSETSAGALGVAGVVALIYGASRAFTAAGRALDTIGGRAPVPRPLGRRARDIGWTMGLVVMGIVTAILLALSGEILDEFLGLFGVSGAAVTFWSVLRWPAAVLLALVAIAVVRWAAPTGTRPGFRLLSPGALVSVGAWIVATIGYGIYLNTLATYDSTYGAFAGAVTLLLWMWLGAAALLYGAELDAVLKESGEVTPEPSATEVRSVVP